MRRLSATASPARSRAGRRRMSPSCRALARHVEVHRRRCAARLRHLRHAAYRSSGRLGSFGDGPAAAHAAQRQRRQHVLRRFARSGTSCARGGCSAITWPRPTITRLQPWTNHLAQARERHRVAPLNATVQSLATVRVATRLNGRAAARGQAFGLPRRPRWCRSPGRSAAPARHALVGPRLQLVPARPVTPLTSRHARRRSRARPALGLRVTHRVDVNRTARSAGSH